jgi:hypothetical protein
LRSCVQDNLLILRNRCATAASNFENALASFTNQGEQYHPLSELKRIGNSTEAAELKQFEKGQAFAVGPDKNMNEVNSLRENCGKFLRESIARNQHLFEVQIANITTKFVDFAASSTNEGFVHENKLKKSLKDKKTILLQCFQRDGTFHPGDDKTVQGILQVAEKNINNATSDALRRNENILEDTIATFRNSRDRHTKFSVYVPEEDIDVLKINTLLDLAHAFGESKGTGMVGDVHWFKVDTLTRETAQLFANVKLANVKKLRTMLAKAKTEFEVDARKVVSTGSKKTKANNKYVQHEILVDDFKRLRWKLSSQFEAGGSFEVRSANAKLVDDLKASALCLTDQLLSSNTDLLTRQVASLKLEAVNLSKTPKGFLVLSKFRSEYDKHRAKCETIFCSKGAYAVGNNGQPIVDVLLKELQDIQIVTEAKINKSAEKQIEKVMKEMQTSMEALVVDDSIDKDTFDTKLEAARKRTLGKFDEIPSSHFTSKVAPFPLSRTLQHDLVTKLESSMNVIVARLHASSFAISNYKDQWEKNLQQFLDHNPCSSGNYIQEEKLHETLSSKRDEMSTQLALRPDKEVPQELATKIRAQCLAKANAFIENVILANRDVLEAVLKRAYKTACEDLNTLLQSAVQESSQKDADSIHVIDLVGAGGVEGDRARQSFGMADVHSRAEAIVAVFANKFSLQKKSALYPIETRNKKMLSSKLAFLSSAVSIVDACTVALQCAADRKDDGQALSKSLAAIRKLLGKSKKSAGPLNSTCARLGIAVCTVIETPKQQTNKFFIAAAFGGAVAIAVTATYLAT